MSEIITAAQLEECVRDVEADPLDLNAYLRLGSFYFLANLELKKTVHNRLADILEQHDNNPKVLMLMAVFAKQALRFDLAKNFSAAALQNDEPLEAHDHVLAISVLKEALSLGEGTWDVSNDRLTQISNAYGSSIIELESLLD